MKTEAEKKRYPMKKHPTISVCGLDCGLCPRYYTEGTSRCPGCCGPDFFIKHPSCSFITCCVKKRNHEVCAECPEFPCSKYMSDEEYLEIKDSNSYPSYKKVMGNLRYIKEHGLQMFLEQQEKQIQCLQTMIDNYNDGRSRSYFCRAANLLDITSLIKSLEKAAEEVKTNGIKNDDKKSQTKILRSILNKSASVQGIVLTTKK